MPNNEANFYIKKNGNIWVETVDSDHRPATEMEWIEFGKSNPALTLKICAMDEQLAA